MSVSELEKRAGLKPSSIQSILLGRSKNPGIERVISLAKQFDCTVEELISPELDVSFSTIKQNQLLVVLPWNNKLFIETTNFVVEFLLQKSILPDLNKVLECIKEIYIYSFKENDAMVDQKFAEWIAKRSF